MIIVIPPVLACLLLSGFLIFGKTDIEHRAIVHYFFTALMTFSTIYSLSTLRQRLTAFHTTKQLERSALWVHLFSDNVFWGKTILLQTVGCLIYTVYFFVEVIDEPFNALAVMCFSMTMAALAVSAKYGYDLLYNERALDFLDRRVVRILFYSSFVILMVCAGVVEFKETHIFMLILFFGLLAATTITTRAMISEVFRQST